MTATEGWGLPEDCRDAGNGTDAGSGRAPGPGSAYGCLPLAPWGWFMPTLCMVSTGQAQRFGLRSLASSCPRSSGGSQGSWDRPEALGSAQEGAGKLGVREDGLP